jgi:hypothetical protein
MHHLTYPDSFKDAVVRAYPNNDVILAHLNSGSTMLGRILDDSAPAKMDVEDIHYLITTGRIDDLLAKVTLLKERREIATQWNKLAHAQCAREDGLGSNGIGGI